MTISLKANPELITGWTSSDGSFSLAGKTLNADEAIRLRDYLNEKLPVESPSLTVQ